MSSPVTAVGAHDERGLVRSLAALGLSTARVTRGFAPPLQRRTHAILQMLSNTQQAGLVVRRGYLHLSRAAMALTGSFSVLYPVGRKRGMLRDLGAAALTAPLALGHEVRLAEQAALRARFGRHPAATRARGEIADRATATLPPLSATPLALVPAS